MYLIIERKHGLFARTSRHYMPTRMAAATVARAIKADYVAQNSARSPFRYRVTGNAKTGWQVWRAERRGDYKLYATIEIEKEAT